MAKRRPKPKRHLMNEAEQHSRCPWLELKAQQELQERRWTKAQLQDQRNRCRRLVEGDYASWEDLLGKK